MATISIEQFAEGACRWAKARNGQFKYNWPVKGGWEGWIQVDLVAYLLSLDSTLEILREQQIFTSPYMKVDLLLNTTLPTEERTAVEIKAESFEQRGTPFINGIVEDIRKLDEDRNTDYSECPCVMLAMPFSQESLDRVLAIQQGGHRIFRNLYLGEVAMTFAVYTEQTGWIPAAESADVAVPAHFPGNPFPSVGTTTAPTATTSFGGR